jgi:hypothetical protein
MVIDLTRKGVHVCFIRRKLTLPGEDSAMSNLLLCTLRFKDGEFRHDVNVRPHGGRLQTPERVSSLDRTGPSSPNSSLATPILGC